MIKLDVLIDDCVDNLVGGDYAGILFSYPWNEGYFDCPWDYDYEPLIRKVNGWSEVPDVINNLNRSGLVL